MEPRFIKIYKGDKVVAKKEGNIKYSDNTYDDTLILLENLEPDTNYPEGTFQIVWEIDGVESERINIPEIMTQYVPVKYLSVHNSKSIIYVRIDEEGKIRAKVAPSFATNQKVTYISSNPEIASIDENGTIHALKERTAEITIFANEKPEEVHKREVNCCNSYLIFMIKKDKKVRKRIVYNG